MTVRIQVLVDQRERAAFQRQARLEGLSLSAWLREAGRASLRAQDRAAKFTDADSLNSFFERCDRHSGNGVEPDWDDHRRIMESSRQQGLSEP
jgi:hypothetical protein